MVVDDVASVSVFKAKEANGTDDGGEEGVGGEGGSGDSAPAFFGGVFEEVGDDEGGVLSDEGKTENVESDDDRMGVEAGFRHYLAQSTVCGCDGFVYG